MLRYSFWGEAYSLWMFMGPMEPNWPGPPLLMAPPQNVFAKKKVVKTACQGGPPVRFMGIIWVESSDIEDI